MLFLNGVRWLLNPTSTYFPSAWSQKIRSLIMFFSLGFSNEALEKCKQRIELIANTLQLEGFSRIDAFVNVDTGEVCSLNS